MSTIEERLRLIFEDHLVPDNPITRESNIIDDLGADSLDTVELAIAVDEEFDILIDEDLWENCTTFGEVVDLVERLLA